MSGRLPAAALVLALAACRRGPGTSESAVDASTAAAKLVAQSRFDDAIARVSGCTDAACAAVLGRAWAGKARTAQLPAPTGGAVPAEGLFKPEELTAIGFLERAIAARPDDAESLLTLGELLAPHALLRVKAERESARPLPPLPGAPDASPERVLRTFAEAMQADPAATAACDALIRFATAAERLGEADAAFQEFVRRKREDPELLVRYGDFLAGPRASPEAALAQYAQALIWRPDDDATRLKMIDIQLSSAASYLDRQEWASAEARLADARRLGVADGSEQARRMREIEDELQEIRGR